MTIAMGAAGPSQGVVAVGQMLQSLYKKNVTESRAADHTLQTLGWSTDNGAYFYGKPETGKDFEQTMIDMQHYAKEVHLPIQYALLDSWWYAQGKGGGVKNWTAQPRIFPDGMGHVHEATGWPFQLHNRYWATDNIYAKQNGGTYDFIVEQSEGYAIPTDQQLWDDLMANATLTGMETYVELPSVQSHARELPTFAAQQYWFEFCASDLCLRFRRYEQDWLVQYLQCFAITLSYSHQVEFSYRIAPNMRSAPNLMA